MRPRKKVRSRRCSECGKWFPPKASAAKTQETCCVECRQAKHNRLGKARRAAEPEKYRAAERKRQARCRAKKAELEGTGPLGRESLPVELGLHVEGVLELALASPRPSRGALASALQQLARACLTQAEAGP